MIHLEELIETLNSPNISLEKNVKGHSLRKSQFLTEALMHIFLFTILIICLRSIAFACECSHVYDAEVIALIDAEGDICSDDYLYLKEDRQSQMIYGIEHQNPKTILKQAQYAFDSFRYNKCLEKIKEYERVAFPPPYDFPSPEEKLVILAYKAYSYRFLKKYDSAINYFEEMIDIIKKADYLAPECRFITYFEHAQCYLLKGDRKEFKNRIKKIIELDIAPPYEYYVKNNFKIHHQPCFHSHELSNHERIVFKELAPVLLGKELYAILEEKGETPKIRTIANKEGDSEFCRRMCARASYISALIVLCITKKSAAMAATVALGELLVDCDVCCKEGWGSENCCRELKWALKQACQQDMLDGL